MPGRPDDVMRAGGPGRRRREAACGLGRRRGPVAGRPARRPRPLLGATAVKLGGSGKGLDRA